MAPNSPSTLTVLFIWAVFLVGTALGGYCPSYRDTYGIYHSGFSCPRFLDSASKIYCCGTSTNKYCCARSSYTFGFSILGTVVGVVFGIIGFAVVVSLILCYVCAACPLYQRRHRGRVIANPVSTTTTTVTTVPMGYQPAPGMVVSSYPHAPAYPPPGPLAPPPPYAPTSYQPPLYSTAGPPGGNPVRY